MTCRWSRNGRCSRCPFLRLWNNLPIFFFPFYEAKKDASAPLTHGGAPRGAFHLSRRSNAGMQGWAPSVLSVTRCSPLFTRWYRTPGLHELSFVTLRSKLTFTRLLDFIYRPERSRISPKHAGALAVNTPNSYMFDNLHHLHSKTPPKACLS